MSDWKNVIIMGQLNIPTWAAIAEQANDIKASLICKRNFRLSNNDYPAAIARWYKKVTGEELDYRNPLSFNQKVQWLKAYDSTPDKGILADKYQVRERVASSIGDQYLVPLLGVWRRPEDIIFSHLPKRFALKATHGCGWNIIVPDKMQLNQAIACKKMKRWLSMDYSLIGSFERHYHYCNPRIIAEAYLDGYETGSLIDYKVHVFNAGDPIVLVCRDRSTERLPKKAYYDSNWNQLPLFETGSELFDCERPKHLEVMLDNSKQLARGFALVRVDWYEVGGQLYFGEMTFTPAGGVKRFSSEEWNLEFGSRIDLSVLSTWQEFNKSLKG